MRTLLLDQSYMPIDVISWKEALRLIFSGKAEIIEEYEDFKVRSPSLIMALPSVLRLVVKHKRHGKHIRFSRINIFWRDNFQCQYCGSKGKSNDLTFDHVIPKSQGGGKSWENIVTACLPCNQKKSGRTPEQARMKLIREPFKPKWTPQFTIRLKSTDPEVWMTYVYWHGSLKTT